MKELASLKDLTFELSVLKEHNAYLLNLARSMRSEMKTVVDKYTKCVNPKEQSTFPELIKRLSFIADTAKEKISEMKRNSSPVYLDWLQDHGKKALDQNIKSSIIKFIQR